MARWVRIASVVAPLILLGGNAAADNSSAQGQPAAAQATPAAQAQTVAEPRNSKDATVPQSAMAKALAENAALTAAAATSAAELERLQKAYTQAQEANRAVTAERDKLKLQLDAAANFANACQAKNARLVAFTEDLLASYRKIGLAQVAAVREPFLGLERVKLENIAQDREDAVRAARCNPRLNSAPPAKPATQAHGG